MLTKLDRRSYNAAYKVEAVRLAVERKNGTSVARDLGIGSRTLQRLVNLSMKRPENPFTENGNTRYVEMESVMCGSCHLKDDNDILTEAVDILSNAQR